MRQKRNRDTRERGQAVVEVTLMMPWIVFLFFGVFDFGFYAHAAICTQNAARAAAVAASETATAIVTPCSAALGEFRMLPNVGYNPSLTCGSLPVIVTLNTLATCTLCDHGTTYPTKQAVVQYQSVPVFPIPGIMNGQMTMTRVAAMRVISP
jgi:hypothetical protein